MFQTGSEVNISEFSIKQCGADTHFALKFPVCRLWQLTKELTKDHNKINILLIKDDIE